MTVFWEILTFRRMIAPYILQILFWAGVGGTFYGAYVLFTLGNWAWPLPIIFGPLLVRVVFEFWILAFKTYDRLGDIQKKIRGD